MLFSFKNILFSAVLLVGGTAVEAQQTEQRYSFSHPQMGTEFRLIFYSHFDSITARAAANRVFAKVDALNSAFSDYQPESELNRLCDKAGSGEKTTVSKPLWDILLLSKQYSERTNGAFDVTIGAVTRLWRRARSMQELPDSSRLAAALQTVDQRHILLYGKNQAQIDLKGTRLDLGGIAQGYAADVCLEELRNLGIRQALADAGGDIALGDPPPGEKGWKIERPTLDSTGQLTNETLLLSNCGITTSGATFRFLEANGVRYSHIIDPRTGMGLTHRNLVTVMSNKAVDADAWATALSVLGPEGWEALKEKYPGVKVWITTY